MHFLVLGSTGRLGQALLATLKGGEHQVTAFDHARLDLVQRSLVIEALSELRPDVVINTVAFNLVDAAQEDPGPAYLVNARAAGNVAEGCVAGGARLVHISTDYVFDGETEQPYDVDDAPNPLSHYGLSKLAGEALCQWFAGDAATIVRTAVIYGPHPHGHEGRVDNFPARVAQGLRDGRALKGVTDLTISPTYTPDLAAAVVAIAEAAQPGVFHVAGCGACTRLDMMRAIAELLDVDAEIEEVSQSSFGASAPRPRYSALSSRRAEAVCGYEMPHWRDGLRRFFEALG